jgi:hypothetical protein
MVLSQVEARFRHGAPPQSPAFPRLRTGSLPFCTSHPQARAQIGGSVGPSLSARKQQTVVPVPARERDARERRPRAYQARSEQQRRIIARGDDAASGHGDRGGLRPGGIPSRDPAVAEDEIGPFAACPGASQPLWLWLCWGCESVQC